MMSANDARRRCALQSGKSAAGRAKIRHDRAAAEGRAAETLTTLKRDWNLQ
jgi:hypothetical protein